MLFIPNSVGDGGVTQKNLDEIIKTGLEESVHLEYKRELNSNNKIAKTLSSFANSDGENQRLIVEIWQIQNEVVEYYNNLWLWLNITL